MDTLIAGLRVKVTTILPSVGTTSGMHFLRIELMRKVSREGAVATGSVVTATILEAAVVGLPNEKIINTMTSLFPIVYANLYVLWEIWQTRSVITGSCVKRVAYCLGSTMSKVSCAHTIADLSSRREA